MPIRLVLAGLLLLLVCGMMTPVVAQDHRHGVTVPDWYDKNCCNQRDCRPVGPDEPAPVPFIAPPHYGYPLGGAAYRWASPTGVELVFYRSQFKASQDERYHVCYNGPITYCIYVPTMA